jgi:glycosyltransferase involved in cell wall biosynthesis
VRIVHLTQTGGIATRLHAGLLRLGQDSQMFVGQKRTMDPTITLFVPPGDLLSRLRRRVRARRIATDFARYGDSQVFELFSDDRTRHGATFLRQLPRGDIYNIHTMIDLVDYQAFFRAVPRRAPVVRTLHDMNFFTGGCHQDAGCGKHVTGCGACPQLGAVAEGDLSRRIWARKRDALAGVSPARLHLVAPSRWIAAEARRSPLVGRFPVTVIPLGIDTDIFRPLPKNMARAVLGVPQNAGAVLLVADPVDRRNKGFTPLVEALEGMSGKHNSFLIIAGGGVVPAEARVPHTHLGYVQQERFMPLVYSAADVLAVPSLQENLPQVVLEAMACGLPVVGSDVGGIPDMVRPGTTGALVAPQDVTALRAAIDDLLQKKDLRARLGDNARQIALMEYRLETQAKRYLGLYEEILAHERPESGRAVSSP